MKQRLTEQLEDIIRHSRATRVGLAAQRIGSGEALLIQPDAAFHPASVMKLCVMLEVYRQRHAGLLSLDETLPIWNQFKSMADGSAYALDVRDDSETELYSHTGERMEIVELVRRMITVSSNLATNILLEKVKPAQVSAFMKELRAEDLVVLRGVEDKAAYRKGLNNSATARGLLTILLRLARRQAVSPQDSEEMIAILCQQKFNEMIPAGLPRDVKVAHKTGWTGEFHHDAGIVFPPDGEAFALAILTEGYTEKEDEAAHALVATLAKAIYDERGDL